MQVRTADVSTVDLDHNIARFHVRERVLSEFHFLHGASEHGNLTVHRYLLIFNLSHSVFFSKIAQNARET